MKSLSQTLRDQKPAPAQPTPQQLENQKYIKGFRPETPQQYLNHLEWEREIERGATLTQWHIERHASAAEVAAPTIARLLESLIEQQELINALADEVDALEADVLEAVA